MLLEEHNIDGSVVATDLSTDALQRSTQARYSTREIAGLSPERIARHLTASAGESAPAAADAGKAGEEFAWLIAKWRCNEKWEKTEATPAFESTATLTGLNVVNGVWLTWTYIQDASPANPNPPKGADLWGYDVCLHEVEPATGKVLKDYAASARANFLAG